MGTMGETTKRNLAGLIATAKADGGGGRLDGSRKAGMGATAGVGGFSGGMSGSWGRAPTGRGENIIPLAPPPAALPPPPAPAPAPAQAGLSKWEISGGPEGKLPLRAPPLRLVKPREGGNAATQGGQGPHVLGSTVGMRQKVRPNSAGQKATWDVLPAKMPPRPRSGTMPAGHR